MTLAEKLEQWIESGGRRIGEVSIEPTGGRLRLVNVADIGVGESELEVFSSPRDVRGVVRYDGAGKYRPLKSAPGLRRGWILWLDDVGQLRESLDYFYPAALGTWFAFLDGKIESVPLREVFGRQTGMYRYANRISDDGAQALVGEACSASGGCLKRVCWELADGQPVTSLPADELSTEPPGGFEMPLLCVEACNWLVAKARKVSAAEAKAREV